ncbi:hypothetical protein V6N13_009788 [Hibiscus sabdariffa]
MTRKNPGTLADFEPEIEARARRIHGQTLRNKRKKQQEQVNSEETTSAITEESTDSSQNPAISEATSTNQVDANNAPKANPTLNEAMGDQTIRELAAAPTVQQPLCITFPQGETPFQLKTGLIHLLPTFHGLPSESPHKHLTEFHLVCSSMKPQGVSEDQIKLRAFPFSLSGIAKEWLFYLPSNSITTWTDLQSRFLDRFFPAAKASEIRRSILGIKQKHEESLYEYWERYKKLCASCPQHGLSEQTLIQYFYEGLLPMEMKMIDAASGGALLNMTPTQARELISTMAANSQQFGAISEPNRRVHEVNNVSIENRLNQLTNIVTSLVTGKINPGRACGICTMTDHPTDCCPSLQEETVNAVGNFPGPPQRPYNPYGNTYNPGWKDHPNFSYAQNQRPNQASQQRSYQQHYQQPQKTSLELMIEKLAASQEKMMEKLDASQEKSESRIQEVEKQVSQLAQTVGRLESRGKLPSQTENNPRANVSAITLRSGTVVEPKAREKEAEKGEEEEPLPTKQDAEGPKASSSVVQPPFPSRLVNRDKQAEDKSILEMFQKVEINMPLLEVIRRIPRYAKFLKDLCTHKKRLTGKEKVNLGEHVSAVFQRTLPPKMKDQGMFAIPCKIGNIKINRAMCDLGASINVMPLSLYNSLSAKPLKETRVTIQLADRSVIYPEGLLENVLVEVENLIFPADFYVIKMEQDRPNTSSEILLGRPFLGTANTKIEVRSGLLSMEFDGQTVEFDVYKAMRYPDNVERINSLDLFDPLVEEFLETNYLNESCREFEHRDEEGKREFEKLFTIHSSTVFTPLKPKMLPSILQAPKLELKQLPEHLKYAFLGENETLPVIISSGLSREEEDDLVEVLRAHKEAIGWTIADIKGLSPSTCMHKINIEEGAKPSREGQRRLNPPMMEVVKNEIQKLLDADVIYPISDSKWVSPIHVVPKKTGVTVVENSEGELVPTRVQNGWRVCIDYRKLNSLTRKDHFPLPFIDQMIERLAGKSHYCCLDGFSGFFQIPVAPEDQEKTTFTCPFGTFAYRRMPFGLCNAPATFQRCMLSIFSDYVEKGIEVFMDDFTVYGNSFSECLLNLENVLNKCLEYNLVLNYEKCHFMVDKGLILGHIVSSSGIAVDKAKTDVIRSLPYPTTVRDIRSFLGHAGFYRRFIKDFSKIAQPLCTLLQKDQAFEFDERCRESFDILKEKLVSAPIVQPPNWDYPFELMCDASDTSVGVVLGQKIGKEPHVIAYASRTLDAAQKNYSTTKKELFSIIFALDKFRSYLLGTKIIVFSDHAAIRYLMNKKEAKPRLTRWILLLQEFDLEIKDKKGCENLVADHLSRLPISTIDPPVREEFPEENLMMAQSKEPWFADMVNYLAIGNPALYGRR